MKNERIKGYSELKTAFVKFDGILKTEKTIDGHSLESLESEITSEISSWRASFKFFVDPVEPDEIVKNLIRHQIHDHALDKTQDPQMYGEGFQRYLIFTLIRLAARHSATFPAPTRKEFSPQLTWILFEEPEAFLDPNLIDVLAESLRTLSLDDNSQVVATTHSPQFVSKNIEDLTSIARFHIEGPRSIVKQVNVDTLNTILTTNQSDLAKWVAAGIRIHPDDLTVEMESIKYALWLNPLRCSSFYANRVLLVPECVNRFETTRFEIY